MSAGLKDVRRLIRVINILQRSSSVIRKERKGKEEYLYSAFSHQGTHKALRHGSHSFTCKQHHACLSFVSVQQMSPPQQLRQQTSNCSSLLEVCGNEWCTCMYDFLFVFHCKYVLENLSCRTTDEITARSRGSGHCN